MTQDSIIRLFSFNTGSGISIYRQLVDQIKQAVRMKLVFPQQQLPSVRILASALQINPMTISKAFAQLELEGVLIRKRGVGMLVAEAKETQQLTEATEKPLIEFIRHARAEKLSDENIITLVQQYLSIHLATHKQEDK